MSEERWLPITGEFGRCRYEVSNMTAPTNEALRKIVGVLRMLNHKPAAFPAVTLAIDDLEASLATPQPKCSLCNDTGRVWDNGDKRDCSCVVPTTPPTQPKLGLPLDPCPRCDELPCVCSAQPAWKAECRVVQCCGNGKWDVYAPSHWLTPEGIWLPREDGCEFTYGSFPTEHAARLALANCPTPPPGYKEKECQTSGDSSSSTASSTSVSGPPSTTSSPAAPASRLEDAVIVAHRIVLEDCKSERTKRIQAVRVATLEWARDQTQDKYTMIPNWTALIEEARRT